MATVRVIAAAIRRAHLDAGRSSPTAQPGVKRMLAGIARTSARPARQGAVDIALAYVLATGGLRRSEAAALTWDCLEHQPDGSGRVGMARRMVQRPARDYLVSSSAYMPADSGQALIHLVVP